MPLRLGCAWGKLVIVDCESCHTRFRLDDAKIPATGAKVRCSRCKKAFIVHRPGTGVHEVVQEVVAEATNPSAPRAPDTTGDLFEASGRVIGEPQTQPPVASEGGGGEEQWEFDESPPAPRALEVARPRAKPRPTAPAAATNEEARDEEALPALGAPSDWDFLASSAEGIAKEASFRPETARAPERAPAAARVEAPDLVSSTLRSRVAAEASEPTRAPSGARDAFASALDALVVGSGWLTASALCLIGLAIAAQPRPWSSAENAPGAMPAVVDGLEHEASLYHVENAVAGTLLVVRGQLPPSGVAPSARLRARWLDAAGAPLGEEAAIAGPPVSKRDLRELSLARLEAEHTAHAAQLTGGGPYEAVFAALPSGAARISLAREELPAAVAQAATAEGEAAVSEGEQAGRAAANGATAGATASSPPAAPPSSE